VEASLAVLGYGPAPGVELIPYFLALLGWVALAFASVLLSPFAALLRRLRGRRGGAEAAPKGQPEAPQPPPADRGEGP
jgi:hypothetical protein